MKNLPFLLSFLLAFVGAAQSPLPSTKTFSVITGTNGILTGASTNFFALNTNLLFRATAPQIALSSNAMVAALIASNTAAGSSLTTTSNALQSALNGVSSARISDINGASNTLSSSISSLSSSVATSISSAVSSATSTITSAYTSAITAAQNALGLAVATRSVNSIAALIALRTDSLPGATNGLSVLVRGYYDREGAGGGMFHLAPSYALPADVLGTNRGTCFATVDNTNLVWLRQNRSSVSIQDFGAFCNAGWDDHNSVQDAVNSCQDVTFPAATTTKIGTGSGNGIDVPSNRQLHIKGTLIGPDFFRFAGNAVVDGGGTVTIATGYEPRGMQFAGGEAFVRDLNFVSTGFGIPVLVSKSASMTGMSVDRCRFDGVYIGVLRENWPMSTPNPIYVLQKFRITGCVFTNIFCIGADREPNLADGSLEVIGNRFSYVHFNDPLTHGFGGFALGIAGWTADNYGNESVQLHNVTVRGNIFDRCREAVHVEYCTDVDVSENRFANIDEGFVTNADGSTYSPGSVTTAITLYECVRATVTGNVAHGVTGTTRWGIYCSSGWGDGQQEGTMDRLTISGNVTEGAGIYAEAMPRVVAATNYPAAMAMPFVGIFNNVVRDGPISFYGRGQLTLMNNFSRGSWGSPALTLDTRRYWNSQLQTDLRIPIVIKGNVAINPIGAPSFSFASFEEAAFESNMTITADGNNFPVVGPGQKANPAGSVFYSTNGVPYGVTFKKGDIVLDTSHRPPRTIMITQGGSRTVPLDYCNALPSTNAAKGWVAAATLPWGTGGYHHPGQLVQVTGTPGPITGMISDIWYDAASLYVVARLVDPSTGLNLNLTGFTPSLMQALNEVGYSTQGELATTWNPPSVAAGASYQLSPLYVPGALPGDQVTASFSLDLQGLVLTGGVTTNDYCRIVLQNTTTNAVDLVTGTLSVLTRNP